MFTFSFDLKTTSVAFCGFPFIIVALLFLNDLWMHLLGGAKGFPVLFLFCSVVHTVSCLLLSSGFAQKRKSSARDQLWLPEAHVKTKLDNLVDLLNTHPSCLLCYMPQTSFKNGISENGWNVYYPSSGYDGSRDPRVSLHNIWPGKNKSTLLCLGASLDHLLHQL